MTAERERDARRTLDRLRPLLVGRTGSEVAAFWPELSNEPRALITLANDFSDALAALRRVRELLKPGKMFVMADDDELIEAIKVLAALDGISVQRARTIWKRMGGDVRVKRAKR